MPATFGKQDLQFLTIMGDQTEELGFRLLSLEDGQEFELPQSLSYKVNQHLGTPSDPLIVHISDKSCAFISKKELNEDQLFTVYPSIFSEWVSLEYISRIKDESANWVLYNINGQIQKTGHLTLDKGFNALRLKLGRELPAGVYFFKLEGHGISEQTKLIKH
jgi:hypothetical protein